MGSRKVELVNTKKKLCFTKPLIFFYSLDLFIYGKAERERGVFSLSVSRILNYALYLYVLLYALIYFFFIGSF
ncbi:hypothetical protein, partial [Peribacillus simplex]|uniref:hypothetical protein n=1 Tax=Peribacillus simplex TaxID=1478 RepID=UPI003D29EA40